MGLALVDVTRFDTALPPALFEAISAMALGLSEGPNPKGTFWQDLGTPAHTVIAVAASRLFRLVAATKECAGVEWWVRLRPADVPMGFHFDKDESLIRLTGRMRHPAYSSVLYLTDAGGPTIVVDQSVSSDGRKLRPPKAVLGVLSEPRRNGFLVFPGQLRHAVVAGERLDQHGTKSVKRGSLLMNWWPERPSPPGCREPPHEALTAWEDTADVHLPHSSQLPVVRVRDLSDFAPN